MGLAPTPHELLGNRTDSRALLTDAVVVQRPTYSPDGKGGQTMAYVAVHAGPGRLATMGLVEIEYYAAKIGLSQGWIVSLESGRDVRPDDRLLVRSRTFEPVATDFGATDAWLQRIPCREIA